MGVIYILVLLPTFEPLTTKSGFDPSSFGARVWMPKRTASTLPGIYEKLITKSLQDVRERVNIVQERYGARQLVL